ncbi:RcpC/CpaB family pilus assembly protein [Afipia birgiae]|jgi:Flp pilus assembly protein CpaB|uniref:RcpC/CpaB family pilus assembly protein n=1 Tax=Afipia birgiae TaxID=151414 RepID=UPI00035D49B9|nr:RcpC/CpaB family pilus assembly protein [Afipia birgiae]
MWKVKRKMNTARIVVLTLAVCAGGTAAHSASGSSPKQVETPVTMDTTDVLVARSDIALGETATLELQPEQAEALARARQAGKLSLALRSLVGATNDNIDEAGKRDRGNVVRYGASTTMTTRK